MNQENPTVLRSPLLSDSVQETFLARQEFRGPRVIRQLHGQTQTRSFLFHSSPILRVPFSAELYMTFRRCPWCNGYRRRKWTRRHEFKSCPVCLRNLLGLKLCIQPLTFFSIGLFVRVPPLVYSKNGPEYLLFGEFSAVEVGFLILLRFSILIFFFHLYLIESAPSQPQVLVVFLFSQCSFAFLILLFYTFRYFSFTIFYYLHSTFFGAKFHPYILAV